ncbi:MAG: hypothetical protein ABEJ62_02855, partial [Candidatus Nanohaloarchaea archaeon]
NQYPMRKTLVLLSTILVLSGAAAAQTELDVGPGMVTPDSPVYGLEVAWDNAAMSIGLKNAGTVVQERAAEARAMQRRNNTGAMREAVRQMSHVAERARGGDAQGLQKAQAVLQQVMQRAPEQARQGLRTALNNMQQAMQRIPGDVPAGPGEAGPGTGQGAAEPGAGGRGGNGSSSGSGTGGGQQTNQSPDTTVQNRPMNP